MTQVNYSKGGYFTKSFCNCSAVLSNKKRRTAPGHMVTIPISSQSCCSTGCDVLRRLLDHSFLTVLCNVQRQWHLQIPMKAIRAFQNHLIITVVLINDKKIFL